MVQGLTRRRDWRGRLFTALAAQQRESFTWGQNDCWRGLAATAIEAITGHDLRGDWRGYRSAAGAFRMLRKRGFTRISDAVAELLPEHECLADAQLGDIGVIPSEGEIGEALCVVDTSSLIVLTEAGHGRAPRSDMIRAFRVGKVN